jgi:hypothetical protein
VSVVKKAEDKNVEIDIIQLRQGRQDFHILGSTPLVYNSVSFKARTEGSTGLLPAKPKNKTARSSTPKHEPWREYRESVYRHRGDNFATRLMIPARMFKGAMRAVTARIPGVFGTEVGQLLWVEPNEISLYGTPQIWTTMVRSADAKRTPDMRTRAIVPEWACMFSVRYVMPNISGPSVVALLGNAGLLCGVGDARSEKGKHDNGQFVIVDKEDPTFRRIISDQGRDVQDDALSNPLYYDTETQELLTWYQEERVRRDGSYDYEPADDDEEDLEQMEAAD